MMNDFGIYLLILTISGAFVSTQSRSCFHLSSETADLRKADAILTTVDCTGAAPTPEAVTVKER